MSALLVLILGLSNVTKCEVEKVIFPCNCMLERKVTTITCKNMTSFDQLSSLLRRGNFSPFDKVALDVEFSNMVDLSTRSFKELNLSIENMNFKNNIISEVKSESFDGLKKLSFLSISDNNLEQVPEHLWKKMPLLGTLDLARTKIKELFDSSFTELHKLRTLILAGNQISRMDRNSFPEQIKRLHLGRNSIKDLNGTLTKLSNLNWLFINNNELTTLENELPFNASKLYIIHAGNNMIEEIPQQLKTLPALESFFFQDNKISSLDGALSKSRKLSRVVLDFNRINTITENDFAEAEMLETLMLSYNEITSLNNSLKNLGNLKYLNVSYNLLTEFSLQEIAHLQNLSHIVLSFNQITTLIGPPLNLVESKSNLVDLKLDHNFIEVLNGALAGLRKLTTLNLSHNRISRISPDDLIGLDKLKNLDLSHNQLTTLEEMGKTYLPNLSELIATNNYLKILDKDFHGLPDLCKADLSDNKIIALGRQLVAKTRCKIKTSNEAIMRDTLQISLHNNPILCDAALPEITTAMEKNHTRISGVSHCPPLSEQPVTKKPNNFLGYIPESDPILSTEISESPAAFIDNIQRLNFHPIDSIIARSNDLPLENPEPVLDLRKTDQYHIENQNSDPIKSLNVTVGITEEYNATGSHPALEIDSAQRDLEINQLKTQVAELQNKVHQLSDQNMLLNKQFNQTQSSTPTPTENSEKLRMP